MKKVKQVTGLIFLLLTVAYSVGWAMDFVNMSNEELYELRGAVQNAPETDQKAYQVEWDKRLSSMTDEEQELFSKPVKDEEEDGKLGQPFIPAKGYEKESIQGNVIFGGFPGNAEVKP